MRIVVNQDLCTGCEGCIPSCPYDAIAMNSAGKAEINEYCQLCSACMETCPVGAISRQGEAPANADAGALDAYRGVWVFAEQRRGRLASVGMELLGAGRKLADRLGVELSAVLLGADDAAARELIEYGADRVYHAPDESLDAFNDEAYAEVLTRLIREHRPEAVLAGATPIGRSFVPRVAAELRAGMTADCTELGVDDDGSRNLLQIRPAFGGNIMATILCPANRPQIATVRPRVMRPNERDASRKGEVVKVAGPSGVIGTEVLDSVLEVAENAINLQDAHIIVSGGRGLGKPEGFVMLAELAELLGGSVGASRAAVDEGWIPYRHQVGQTGKTVCPKIYIACGISGAVQHLVGMQSSDIIIAINRNADAPIFKIATMGIVGDLYEVIPALIRKLRGGGA